MFVKKVKKFMFKSIRDVTYVPDERVWVSIKKMKSICLLIKCIFILYLVAHYDICIQGNIKP